MTTATHPEFFTSYDEASAHKYNMVPSNPRYKFFKQSHFTAGDEEQFETHRRRTTLVRNKTDVHRPLPITFPYYSISPDVVDSTFRYLFHKFKKGIFVQLKNNQVRVFLPFSNIRYRNEFSHLLAFNPHRFQSWNAMFERVCNLGGYEFKPYRINKFRHSWHAVNGVFRYEFPPNENGTGAMVLCHMLKELCKRYKVPDIEFFINRKDYPILTRDGTEPYEALFGRTTPLISHCYPMYSPILSMCVTDRHADICIPTTDEWARICSDDSIYFPRTQNYKPIPPTKWEDKIPIAVFRGSSTGYGITPETNPRLKLVLMDNDGRLDDDGRPFLDAGFTKWNLRPRKDGAFVDIFADDVLNNVKLKEPLDGMQQSKFKYIVHVDGHVAAYRLAYEMSYGSVLLKVDSPYKLWFSDRLEPYKHYVPVKSDLSDLYSQIQWCKSHDNECRVIACNAFTFYQCHLQKDNVLEYLQRLLYSIPQTLD